MSVKIHIANLKLSPKDKGINVVFNQNEHWALLGPAGCGKTTIALHIAGKKLINGSIQIQYFEENPFAQQAVVYVEQRHEFKNLSNVNDFYYQQRFNSLENEDAETIEQQLLKINSNLIEIDHILTDFELINRKKAPIIQLSSGEHKRLQLAKAFLKPSKLMLLDEPFIGLDTDFRQKFNLILKKYAAKGITFITITSANEIPEIATHIALMEANDIIQTIKKEDFIPKPTTPSIKLAIPQFKSPNISHLHPIIEMKNIKIKYQDKTIIEGLNWKVNPNEKWLITGQNGAGKSTLLSLITGDNPQAYSNELYLFGKRRGRGESIWDIKKNMGYLSPELHACFDKKLTVFNAIASGLFDSMGLYQKLNESQEAIVHQWIKIFKLEKEIQKPLQYISHSQQRWVLLARALVKNPSVLIFDEPCQGFSLEQKNLFLEVIDQLCQENDKTLIYVSHYEDELPKAIDYKLIFKNNTYQIHKN